MSDTSFESVIDYLNSLAWDETPRLDRWLVECAGADDSPYVRAVSRAMLIAAVRRARHPGCRFDQMPVLEGPQGCGKSAALRVLADAWLAGHASNHRGGRAGDHRGDQRQVDRRGTGAGSHVAIRLQ